MYDERDWWKYGVIYQIYPRSFGDSDGDGVGDLAGITAHLDHLEWLGIDGIWISPVFRSPMKDFGYDVSDYCDIDPRFGTLDDMDRLIDQAHGRGIRVLLDFVPNHSSDQHPWFVESRSSRDHPKRDWYWWRDAKPDGGRPNNWKSNFIGDAWTFDEVTGQYYLHSFLPEQPDLNWANPEVVEAMQGVLRFWLDRGVDGFRIDVVHAMAKDAELRDNPPNPKPPRPFWPTNEYWSQLHVYDINRPEVHDIIRGFRRVFDEYGATSVGEVYLLDPEEMVRYYGTGSDELHMAFNFAFLWSPWQADAFRSRVEQSERLIPPGGQPNYTLSNHDHPRHATRYGEGRVKAAAVLLLALRGTPFIYYGEELGMPDVEAASGHDPVGRDPERTPMRWDASPKGGFTAGDPWLPLCPPRYNVADQRDDPGSVLSFYRRLIGVRRAEPALHAGDYLSLPAPDGVFAWRRSSSPDDVIDVAVNMGATRATVDLHGTVLVATEAELEGRVLGGATVLAPDAAVVVRATGP